MLRVSSVCSSLRVGERVDVVAADLEFDSEKPPHENLSDREYQVLCLLASGKRLKDIADQLDLSIKTISTYRTRILDKMNMNNNAEMIRYALQNKLVI